MHVTFYQRVEILRHESGASHQQKEASMTFAITSNVKWKQFQWFTSDEFWALDHRRTVSTRAHTLHRRTLLTLNSALIYIYHMCRSGLGNSRSRRRDSRKFWRVIEATVEFDFRPFFFASQPADDDVKSRNFINRHAKMFGCGNRQVEMPERLLIVLRT